MKKITKIFVIFALMLLLHLPSFGQITLEHTYPNASLKLYMVNLEVSGAKYLIKSDVQNDRYLKFYNLDHSLWKTIDCNPFPTTIICGTGGTMFSFEALYISENLFDCDSSIEFLYSSLSDCKWFTGIYNEKGVALLIADSSAPLVKSNVPQQYRPIYNTSEGTKLILSHKDGSARVYDLPCALATDIDKIEPNSINTSVLNVFPNPTFYQTTIEFKLPDDINQGELLITDNFGREVKRYKVDNNFSNIYINKNDIPSGTYYYSLISKNKVLNSKKVIILQ